MGSSGNLSLSDTSAAPKAPTTFMIVVFAALAAMALTLAAIKFRNKPQMVP
jgi:hypothetical protein